MNKIVIHRTLSKRLSRTIILLAVPLFILSLGVFYQHARNMLHREAVERSFTTLKTTERLVDNYLKTIETAARSNQWVIEENFNPDSIPAITRRLVKLNRLFAKQSLNIFNTTVKLGSRLDLRRMERKSEMKLRAGRDIVCLTICINYKCVVFENLISHSTISLY